MRPRGGWCATPMGYWLRVLSKQAAMPAVDRRLATDSVWRAAAGRSGRLASASMFASTELSGLSTGGPPHCPGEQSELHARNRVGITSSFGRDIAARGRRHAGVKSSTTCVMAVWPPRVAVTQFARAAASLWRHAAWWLLPGVDHPTSHRLACLATASLFAVCGSISAAWAYDAQLAWSPVSGAVGYRVYTRASGQSYGAGSDAGTGTLGGDGAIHYVVTGLATGV